MRKTIIAGTVKPPEQKREKQLYQQLGRFADWIQKPKDLSEVQKDKLRPVPAEMLPVVF